MTGIRTCRTIVQKGPNRHDVAIPRQRNGDAALITSTLPIDVSAKLGPGTATVLVHPNMTCTGAIAVIQGRPYCNTTAVVRQRDRSPTDIDCSLSVYVGADLVPSIGPRNIVKHTNMPGVGARTVV
jgi:hypothetical protein